jgi:hypothetical protein
VLARARGALLAAVRSPPGPHVGEALARLAASPRRPRDHHCAAASPPSPIPSPCSTPPSPPPTPLPRFLVLDEADRLLDPTFEAPLRSILSALPPHDRQTLLFSATMTQALVKLQAERLAGAHVFQAYTGLQTAEKLRQVGGGHGGAGAGGVGPG